MKALKSAEKFGQTVGAALGALITKFASSDLISSSISSSIKALFFVAIIVVTSKFTEALVCILIDRSTLLRRLICGHNYIEGTWIDYTESISEIGVITIRFVEGKLTVHGEAYNINGDRIGKWDSIMANFDGKNLEYTYTCDIISNNQLQTEVHGYSKVTFRRINQQRSPEGWTGIFTNFAPTQVIHQTYAIRLSPKEAKNFLTPPIKVSNLLAKFGKIPQANPGNPQVDSETTQANPRVAASS